MNYTNEDFIRLMDEVENQGGEHLEDLCGGQEYEYTMRDGEIKTHFTAGCEAETMFDVAYDPHATVMVPEPVLEPDPARDGRSHRTKLQKDPTDPKGKRKRPVIRMVKRTAEGQGGLGELHVARVCAGHDDVGRWPRFRHVIQDVA